jgi:hypothetical protein
MADLDRTPQPEPPSVEERSDTDDELAAQDLELVAGGGGADDALGEGEG